MMHFVQVDEYAIWYHLILRTVCLAVNIGVKRWAFKLIWYTHINAF